MYRVVKAKRTKKQTSPGSASVTVDRRTRADRRRGGKGHSEKVAGDDSGEPKLERRKKVNRRRQIDPTTCERDYTEDEVEFMRALDSYKRTSGRMFPTCSELLEVLRGLGYQKTLNQKAPNAETCGESTLQSALADADNSDLLEIETDLLEIESDSTGCSEMS